MIKLLNSCVFKATVNKQLKKTIREVCTTMYRSETIYRDLIIKRVITLSCTFLVLHVNFCALCENLWVSTVNFECEWLKPDMNVFDIWIVINITLLMQVGFWLTWFETDRSVWAWTGVLDPKRRTFWTLQHPWWTWAPSYTVKLRYCAQKGSYYPGSGKSELWSFFYYFQMDIWALLGIFLALLGIFEFCDLDQGSKDCRE